jgi:mannose-6-phosphate isomerase-like protein (cupin superfamily)
MAVRAGPSSQRWCHRWLLLMLNVRSRKRPPYETLARIKMNTPPDLIASLDAFINAFSYPAEQGLLVKNLADHPVHARADRGNSAAYFSFPDLKSLEAHVSEIPPASATPTHRHSCEALFYVLSGSGHSVLRREGHSAERIEWAAGDLFCTPIHVWHRHVNTDSTCPARYLEITTIPLMKALDAWHIEAVRDEAPGLSTSPENAA